MNYLRISNLTDMKVKDVETFEALLAKDSRVKSFSFKQLKEGKAWFDIDLENDGDVLKGTYKATKIAKVLNCSERQAQKNARKNREYDRSGINIDKGINIYAIIKNCTPIHKNIYNIYSDIKKASYNLRLQHTTLGYQVSFNGQDIQGYQFQCSSSKIMDLLDRL